MGASAHVLRRFVMSRAAIAAEAVNLGPEDDYPHKWSEFLPIRHQDVDCAGKGSCFFGGYAYCFFL